MSRSLTLKLILAFLVVSITGAALAAFVSRWMTVREFNQLVVEQAQNNFVANVSIYYQVNGSWNGVMDYLRKTVPAPLPGQTKPGVPQPPRPAFVFMLADQNGIVAVPAGPHRIGNRLPAAELAEGTQVEVDGQVVGTVLATGDPPPLDPREERYLVRTNQALFFAALGATAVALILGVVLARTLTQPLRELTTAIHEMAKGDLKQRVSVRSEDELGELAAAFNQMSADLDRANQLRRQMTADIAHDLRNPLTVITGYTESLRDGVLKPSPEKFEVLHNEARNLQRLVEDLRVLSMADAGELRLNRQPVAPQDLLEQLATAYAYHAEGMNITLQVKAEPGLPELSVDPERMAQVLGNLVSNAIRHTPDGGLILLCARREAENVQLMVQDNGEGIPPDELPRIFDRFYRGDATRQQQEGESGLGLAIAKTLVEEHGGSIAAASEPGRGTTMVIALPIRS